MSTGFSVADLKRLIIGSLGLEGMTPEMIDEDAPLFGEGLGLDSVDALELVVAIEKCFAIKIQNDAIKPEALATVRQMHRFIEEQIVQAQGSR